MKKLKTYRDFIVIILAILGALSYFAPASAVEELEEEIDGLEQAIYCSSLKGNKQNIQAWILDLHIKYDGNVEQCSSAERAALMSKELTLGNLNFELKDCGGR